MLTQNTRAFLFQCPIAALSIVLVLWRMPEGFRQTQSTGEDAESITLRSRLKRIDILGALMLPITLVSFFLTLELAGKASPWYYATTLAGLSLIFAMLFIWVEKYYAKEPIFPLELVMKRDVLTANSLIAFQLGGQFIV